MPEISEEWRERIDVDVRSLSERMAGVETGMSSLGRSFDQFTRTYEANAQTQRELHKPQWQIMISGLTLVLLITGMLLAGFIKPMEKDVARIDAAVHAIQGNRTSWEDPVQNEKLQVLQQEILAMRLNEHDTLKTDAIMLERVADNTRMVTATAARWDERFKREIVIHDKIRGTLTDRIHLLESHVFTSHPQMKSLHLAPEHLDHKQ